jgi:hypothetical protein
MRSWRRESFAAFDTERERRPRAGAGCRELDKAPKKARDRRVGSEHVRSRAKRKRSRPDDVSTSLCRRARWMRCWLCRIPFERRRAPNAARRMRRHLFRPRPPAFDRERATCSRRENPHLVCSCATFAYYDLLTNFRCTRRRERASELSRGPRRRGGEPGRSGARIRASIGARARSPSGCLHVSAVRFFVVRRSARILHCSTVQAAVVLISSRRASACEV